MKRMATLTTEKIRSLFNNNFDLANYAIQLGQFYIYSGREVNAQSLLEEVERNPSETYLETLKLLEKEDEEEESLEQ